MTTRHLVAALAATLTGSLLATACVTEGEITGATDDPTPNLLPTGPTRTTSGIAVLNGLDPEAFWDADVQDHLVDFLNEPLKGSTGAAALMGPTASGQEFLPYAARGALGKGNYVKVPDGTGSTYPIKGLYGMADDWRSRKLTKAEQEMNVTYWGASLNAKNLPAEIGIHARYAPFNQLPPKDMNFFEGVYFVLWEGSIPQLFVAPSDTFFDLCGDAQLLVRGRCGNANPSACGLHGINEPAEKVCTFDAKGAPIECKVGTDVALYPMKVVGSTVTCDI